MNRDELNEIYRELEKRMHKIIAPFTLLHNGFDFSYGYYHKGVDEYLEDFYVKGNRLFLLIIGMEEGYYGAD